MNVTKLPSLRFEGIYADIPEHTQGALLRYVDHKILPGGFLTAVLSNNLFEAVGQADSDNIKALPLIVKYIYNKCPGNCHGSKQRMVDYCIDAVYERMA